MKSFNNSFIALLVALLMFSCDNGIDSITTIVPSADESAPTVDIQFPVEGTIIKVPDPISPINIKFEVNDDIEVASISVKMDNSEIASFKDFLDYRIVKKEFTYDNVTAGNHILTITATDLDGKSTTSTVNYTKEPPYMPLFAGETLYMPFDGDFVELISISSADKVGNPSFAGESKIGLNSLSPGTDSYITFPAGNLLTNEFSASFWYKVNASPDRAGILIIGDDADDRNQGFRLFREGSATEQRIKANIGTGTGDSWNDGGVIDVIAGEWVHIAFTISNTQSIIYLNGEPVNTAALGGAIDWTGCYKITIGAGGDTFSYWNHLSDSSSIDDLRFFNKALTQEEIQAIKNANL